MQTHLWFFGRMIAAQRHDLKLSQEYVGEHIGVHPTTLSWWERGGLQRLPKPELYRDLCAVLRLDPVAVFEACDYVKRYPQAVRRWKLKLVA